MMSKIGLVGAASVCLALIVISTLTVSTIRVRRKAQAFLGSVEVMKPGKSGLADVKKLAQEYEGDLKSCGPKQCEAYFFFSNTLLHLVRLAPEQAFTGWLKVENGTLTHVLLRFYSATGDTSTYAQVLDLAQPEAEQQPYWAQLQYNSSSGKAWRAIIKLTPEATIDQRVAAYTFDLRCLSIMGGCEDALQMLPKVWLK
jgi:hypothetical protein